MTASRDDFTSSPDGAAAHARWHADPEPDDRPSPDELACVPAVPSEPSSDDPWCVREGEGWVTW